MRVLMITGDKRFTLGNPRYDLQASAVDELVVLYWGQGNLFPMIPKGHFDVVTAQDPFWRGHLAMHLAWFFSAKLNIQIHSDLSAYSWLKRHFAILNLRKADSIRVVSEKIKQQVERCGVRVKITVLPVFVDIEKFRTVVRKEHQGKNILWLGRFEKEKNPLQAIDVLRDVLKDIPDAKLIMLGAGSMGGEIVAYTGVLPVSIEKWQDPIPFLEIADVVISTSKYESWGSSMVEALAAGVPVAAPDVGIAKEAGAIVVPREKLAEAVIEVLKSGERGVLKLPLLPARMWTVQWRQSLI